MRAAAEVLEEFGVACEVTVVSAHRWAKRTLERVRPGGRGERRGDLLVVRVCPCRAKD
jgi:phosphoribosylcarboxyaminoimidazole (NCAIR) mutase